MRSEDHFCRGAVGEPDVCPHLGDEYGRRGGGIALDAQRFDGVGILHRERDRLHLVAVEVDVIDVRDAHIPRRRGLGLVDVDRVDLEIVFPEHARDLLAAHGDVSALRVRAVEQSVILRIDAREFLARLGDRRGLLPLPRERETLAVQSVVLHVAYAAVDDEHRLGIDVVRLRHAEIVLLDVDDEAVRAAHPVFAEQRRRARDHGIGLVNGHRHAPRREHVARIKPRQHPLYGRILREELAGISDEGVFGEAEHQKRDIELVDDLLRHVLGHQCVQSDGEIDVVGAEIRGRKRDVQHRSARGGVLGSAIIAARRRAGVRDAQMEIVVLVERGQVVIIEDEGEQIEVGVQLIIIAHPLVAAVEERDAPAHVRVAYLGGDIAHFRAVGHLFHKLRVELVRGLETRLHSRHRTRDGQPFRGDVRAVLGEGDGHLAAEIGQHGEKFRGVVYAERRKQRR